MEESILRPRAAVVGGVNIDIGGRPNRPLIERDSNPGKVSISLGGVGRNNRCRRFNGRSSSVFRLCSGFCAAGSQGKKHCRNKQKSN